MTDNYKPVVFGAGAPIDVNNLNQLQANIASIYAQNGTLVTTNQTVGELEKTVKVFPVIYAGQTTITVDGEKTEGKNITFGNTSFTAVPTIVASISSDLKKDFRLFVRATATSSSGGRIEVVNASKNREEVDINYIAIQMKVIE